MSLLSQAATYPLKPGPSDLRDLDHRYAYTWGADFTMPAGTAITEAQLIISDIWDWQVESDALFIHLLDWARVDYKSGGGVRQNVFMYEDNTADEVIEDWFLTGAAFEATAGSNSLLLGVFSDPMGGDPSQASQAVFTLDSYQLATLNSYIANDGRFGFGFDPDCYYYNNGVTLHLTTAGPSTVESPTSVPDVGSSALLLLVGLVSLAGLRRQMHA